MNDKVSRAGIIAVLSIIVYGLIAAERVVHAIDPELASTPIPYLSLGATFATLAMTYYGLKSKKKFKLLTVLGIVNVIVLAVGGYAVGSSALSQYYKWIDWSVATISLAIAILFIFICIDES